MNTRFFKNASIYTAIGNKPLSGPDQSRITAYENGAMLVDDGIIKAIGLQEDVQREVDKLKEDHKDDKDFKITQETDLEGSCVIPGFIDPHTHICFAARREKEFSMRLAGSSYLDILKAGGGILSSVKAVRDASEQELYSSTWRSVVSAMKFGTTAMEIKSGYGLDTESELKMLKVIDRIGKETPLDVSATFMGGHAVPEEYKDNPDGFVDVLINEMLPAVKEQGIAKSCDVFCEEGVFSKDQSRRILEKARELGFSLRIHADEVKDTGGAALAAELNTLSAEHLLSSGDESLKAMAEKGVIADILPATAYSLKKPYAPARKMIEMGVPVALATDCNPGSCFTESMPFVFGLSVMNMDMTVEEALVGSTLNPAWSLGMADKVGSLETGKQADFLVLDGETPAILAYHGGVSPIIKVYKKGVSVA